MYPSYPDTPEGRAREALEHADGEEYPGAHDSYKQTLRDEGWSAREVEEKYGPDYGFGLR